MYYRVTIYNENGEEVDSFAMWGETVDDVRECLGSLKEEEADDSPERIDYTTKEGRFYGIRYTENGETFEAVVDALRYMVEWYAVQEENTDPWDYGSYDYGEAIEMLKEQGHGLIAVIFGGMCINEIRFDGVF